MKPMRPAVIILLLFIFSCQSALKLDSFKDPDYSDRKFETLLIKVTRGSYSFQKKKENMLHKLFSEFGISSVQNHTLFIPTRIYTENDKSTRIKEKNISAILRVTVIKSGYSQRTIEGNTTEKPYFYIKLEIIDPKNKKTAWIATGYNGGNAFDNLDRIYKEFFIKMTKKLVTDNIVIFKRKPHKYYYEY